jgi:hypothetical protein
MKKANAKSSPSRIGKSVFGNSQPATKTVAPTKKQHDGQPQQHNEEKHTHNARGRPQEHTETWTKATVVLLDRQIYWLDRLASDIRFNTKSAMSRAEIIRAFISAVQESDIDLSQFTSEEAIKEYLLSILKKNK